MLGTPSLLTSKELYCRHKGQEMVIRGTAVNVEHKGSGAGHSEKQQVDEGSSCRCRAPR